MQLPRVVIAGVFLVIAALIAVPAVWKATSSDSKAATSETPSPSPSGGSASPSPSSSDPSRPAGQPLSATIGSVSCPSREVRVTIRNTGGQREDFGIERNDDTAAVPGQIAANATRTVTIRLREDRRTRVQVNWENKPVESRTIRANCKNAGGAPPETPPTKLPHTGPENGLLWTRAATGGAVVLTGLIIFWYGGVWPRRRERIFSKKTD